MVWVSYSVVYSISFRITERNAMTESIEAFPMFLVYFSLFCIPVASTTLTTMTPRTSIIEGDTLVSADGSFELGFFRPGKSRNYYLGIRYKKVTEKEIIWVANRENPLTNLHVAVLNVTREGKLVLFGDRNSIIWSSNLSRTATNPVVQLLDQGNLVVKGSNATDSNILWQSFDDPSDTLLAEMKLGRNFETGLERSLSCWKSPEDPSPGQFSLSIDLRGYPQLIVWDRSAVRYRLGSWNGLYFTGTPELKQVSVLKFLFVFNKKEVYYTWERGNSFVSRLVVNQSGFLQRFATTEGSNHWVLLYYGPQDQCDYYSLCGAYASCNINKDPALCTCLDGFLPKSPKDWSMSRWSSGCTRQFQLDNSDCKKGNNFRKYTGLKLPDTSSSLYDESISLTECMERCLRNCSCTAYANSNINGGIGCLLWFSDLVDMRDYSQGGQDLYIRVAKPETDIFHGKPKTSKWKVGLGIGFVILTAAITGALVIYIRSKKCRKEVTGNIWQKDYISEDGKDEMELPMIDLTTITKATDGFSRGNFLGQGGFGSVYKGKLTDGQEIAVKRLSEKSKQGLKEFKNEVILIAKLQHRNLVKLLGCCIQGDETMLVYEYMPNRSLDYFIFDKVRSKFLDWPMRMHLIGGIARGLLYLHHDSRLRIIHRDLKASNVLLDKNMNPKISDFGLARTFGADQIAANTNKVVGTYGYMAPEYAVDGLFSIKSDVFSFGVLVLETVSGRKNRGFHHPDHYHNLLGHAWKLWMANRPLELTDNTLGDSCVLSEVIRCIHVSLLCVQQQPEDRPDMSSVILMLSSETSLPQPKKPGFFTERNLPEAEFSSSIYEAISTNECTISMLEAR
ncbi:G-type lectin S-receptor-like serine/threonine-protein kinase At4g27290 isoform X2 [Carica papaya]|uniref:G-type lectin S-receptor-like serine/threonine-protein kinase At4g27290 isoform X2 n=1 Tax=Carica papaya TaxID=3649 RepID=UPI000B8C9D47|nr:G-type lectin S-receptor-like serine/threonine-protein kinase At4g27290 isoform X2 [Carica papaya]